MDFKEAYAEYKLMPNISYNIIQYLIKEPKAEIIWKLLKYNDADAWKKENLTQKEKASLIYDGKTNQEDCNVFFDFMMDEATNKQTTFLRIYPGNVYPMSRTVGICCVNLEVFCHSQINHLSNYTTRVDTITQKLLELLNGKDIGGVGVLYFDFDVSTYNHINVAGEKPYKGKVITMGVNLG